MTKSLPDYPEALARALSVVSRLDSEDLALARAAGRLVAAPVIADRDLPPFNRAMMDGYALRSRDVCPGASYRVVADIPAGSNPNIDVPAGACVKIATGAAVPRDCDAVIPHEMSDRASPVSFTIDSIEPGHAIHSRGADARAGAELIAAGTVLRAHHLGIGAAVGASMIRVVRSPRAVILTSGDEVKPVDAAALEPHQIRNSNGPMLIELLRRFGAEVVDHEHLPDERKPTVDAMGRAIERADVVITVGGVSAGERDCFPAAYDVHGVEGALAGAAIQPGRPIHVGRTPRGTIVVGLPGNPVSVLATAHLFIWPIVRGMLGVISSPRREGGSAEFAMRAALPWESRILREPVRPNPVRQAFRPARLNDDGSVTVPQWAGSGDLAHTANTHGLLALPVQTEQARAGESYPFLHWA